MAASDLYLQKARPVILRYGLAVFSVCLALGGALLIERFHLRNMTLFLCAIATAAWYGGAGAALLALLLSCISFAYFFIEPRSALPYFILFVLFTALITGFSTVRRRIQGELLQSRVELEALNKELEAFAYSVSHDLRAPVRHMVAFTELLQRSSASLLDDKSRRYVLMILESAKRMGNLIDDLLAFSKISRAETQKTLVNLDQLVKEAVSEVQLETSGRDIVWRIDPLPVCYGDRSMLRLALVNLISNAVKFTGTRVQAVIEIGFTDQKQGQVVFFVRDNGVGFDMKYLNKLFGVFQRLHPREEFEGTGIGLATVQRIVHRHGGTVWAEGEVDKGASFYFSLSKSQGD